ncbi:hypothetical protein [Clostridium thermosuccinogenes]|uniref:hypothetical protein n=1 Tax=Clostridium thermosuccinogenes TaxID=84032 RepID=UPI000CCC8C5F|nr:hypothetical protein [Pseudoclostridium thermosuccinogenes]PNT91267.1 hypothetical protein CDQ83_15810 [Pseudoclostridium thermosuccinogenes]
MSNMKKYTSIEEFLSDYEKNPQWFNMMVDVQSIQDVGPMYKPVINLVFLSTDLEDFEIYRQKKAKDPEGNDYNEPRYAIASKGLFRIRSAADARFVDTDIYQDKENKTVTATVTMQFRNPSGGWATITQSKTVNSYVKYSGKETNDPDAAQKAETGAQNRCIRKAFNIKPHYSLEQLKKPFVAIYFELDETRDRDVKMAKIAAAMGPSTLLYGSPAKRLQLSAGIDEETGEIIDEDGGKI